MGIWTSVLTVAGAIAGSFIPGIGTALGAGIGASLGSMVGAAIDAKNVDSPPTIDDIKAQGSSEGDGVQYCIGSQCVVSGEVIERGDLYANQPGVEKHPVMYQLPLVISFGRTFTGRPIKKIIELLANGQAIYWNYDEVNIVGTDISATVVEITSYDAGTATTTVTQRYLDLTSTGTSLAALVAGREVTVGGWVAGGNNGTMKVLTSTTLTARLKAPGDPTHAFVTEAAGASVSLFQAAEEKFLWPMWSSIEIGLGTVDQAPPTWLLNAFGAAEVNGMPGEIWVAFDNLPLATFGISVPRFEARIQERLDTDLPGILKDIAIGMGLDECEVDTVDAAGVSYGISVRAPKSFRDVISAFLPFHNLVTQEKDLTFRVLHRLAVRELTIDESELGAQEGDNPDVIPPFSVTREDPKRLPAECQLTYIDKDRHGQTGVQSYRRLGVLLRNIATFSVPLVADKDQAKRAAKRMVYGEVISSEKHGLRLPPSRLDLFESDRLVTTSKGRTRTTLLTRISRGNNYEHELDGQREDPSMYENEDALGGESAAAGGPIEQADPLAVVADIPPLTDDDVETALLYLGGVRETKQATWGPASLFESLGSAYSLVDIADAEARAGNVVGTVPSGVVGWWDIATTITVDLRGGGVPTTYTDDTALTGTAGWWLIGGEVIAAARCLALGGGVYELSRLLRGLMDTGERVAVHGANEPAVEIRPFGAFGRRAYDVAQVGTARAYDAAPVNDTPDGAQAVTATLAGSTVRPFSGCQAVGSRNLPSANDWTVPWKPRTRRPLFPLFTAIPFDLAEDVEVYEVEVWTAAFGALIRTITSSASGAGSVVSTASAFAPTVVYKSTDQVTDFGSNQSTLRLRIFQVGDNGLRSKPYEVTLP